MDFDGTDQPTPANRDAFAADRLPPTIEDQIDNAEETPILIAEVVDESLPGSPIRLPRPRAWTSFLVVGVCGVFFLGSSVVVTFAAILIVHGTISLRMLGDEGMITSLMSSRLGLFVMVVLPQLALVFPAIVAAFLSPVETRRRLSLVRGHWPVWTWVAAAMATPLVGMISAITVGLFLDESESLQELSDVFRSHGENGFMIPLALMIGMTPAFCEELVFRGYMQTRLTKSVGPLAGILMASALFAAFHMDFVHVIAVFPLGVFLGWVTWRSGSLFPAMLGHFVNNAISVVLAVNAPEDNPQMLSAPALAFMAAILACGAAGMAATCYAALMYRPSDSAPIA